MLPRRFWQEMTSAEIASADRSDWICVLPIAAVEQHGPHLPLATDALIASAMVDASVAMLPADSKVSFLPLLSVGKSDEHQDFAGTLSYSLDTMLRIIIETGESLARSGIRKLVIINSHGGNSQLMDLAALELRQRTGMVVVATSWSRFGQPEGLYSDHERRFGIHGGDIETSIMLAACPQLVRRELCANFPSRQEEMARDFTHLRAYGPVGYGWKMQDLNPQGVVGDASAASAAKGQASLDHAAQGFVALLQDIARFELPDPKA